MAKTSSNVPFKKKGKVDLYFLVYYHISQGLNPTQICKKYNWKKTKISYYIKELKLNGYIQKLGYGVWKTTNKPLLKFRKDTTNNLNFLKKVRGHGFQFKLQLPKEIKNWDRRIEYLTKNSIRFSLVGNKSSIIRIILDNHKIWLCNKSIIIYYPNDMSFFSNSAKGSRRDVIHHFYTLVSKIEAILSLKLSFKGNYLFSIPKRHYSLIKNELAGSYLKQGKKLEIRDKDNELWALVDNSLNLQEFELIHKKTAETDTDIVVEPFFNLLRENPKILKDLAENVVLNTRMIKAIQDEVVLLTKFHRK